MLPFRAARAQARRGYATVPTIGNGYRVATSNAGQAIVSLSLVLKAGTRYESKPGVASVLRGYAFRNNKNRTALATIRESELYGGVLSSSLTRENITMTAEFLKGDEDHFASVLASIFDTKFAPHELQEDILPILKSESGSALHDPIIAALEAAHAVAFRTGLANPLYREAAPHDVTAGDVKTYAQQVFGSDVAIVGTGISQEALEALVAKHFPSLSPSGAASTAAKTTCHGGEVRVPHSQGSTVFIGFASPSHVTASPELSVLEGIFDPTPRVKWGNSSSPIASSNGVRTQTVLLPYSDATLFGLVLTGEGEALKKSATQAVASLKALSTASGVKKDELAKGIAKAKVALAGVSAAREGFLSQASTELLASEVPQTELSSHLAAVEKVSASSLSKFVSTMVKGKPTYIGVGNQAPWADEIGL